MIKKIIENIYDTSYEERMDIAAEITKNNQSEFDAIKGYQELLVVLADDEEAIDVINEIIADEKNHVEKLNALIEKYDNISPNID